MDVGGLDVFLVDQIVQLRRNSKSAPVVKITR